MRRLAPARHGGRPAAPVAAETVADQLGAELIRPGLALLERRHPLTWRHGRYPLGRCLEGARAQPGTGLDDALLATPEAAVFLDTETSGLAGGTGTWVFVAGLGRIEGRELVLRQYLLLRLDAEAEMMERVAAELGAAEQLISYNGKGFDLPLLETRLCLNGRRPELATTPHLDLLHPVRRAFASRWPDCRLATCERKLLGVERGDDLPGAEAPAAWLEWLRGGQPGRLGAVLRHNRLDLLSLAVLIPALAEVQREPVRHGADIRSLARHLCRCNQTEAAERLLEAHRRELEPAAALDLAQLKRRRGAWVEALAIWEALAALGDPAAILELAKHHEHVGRDLAQALAYAERLPDGDASAHRRARLRRRLQRCGDTGALNR
ncbi:ribonuclease H-like domain-containing protein [Halochromatium glycolicum]|nr:ribonuclease H-like domain-containing protein [Halochromatium glycolicum]